MNPDLMMSAKQLRDEILAVRTGISSVSAEAYSDFIDRYNDLVGSFGVGLALRCVSDSDLTYSRMNVKPEAMDSFLAAVDALVERASGNSSFHCFVINQNCPREIQKGKYKLFLATPFAPEHCAITDIIIDRAEKELGIPRSQIFRADQFIQTRDIMCKICQSMRESECVICNLSPTNHNVQMEMGIAIGAGKRVVLLKKSGSTDKALADIAGMEYIPYSDGDDRWWTGLVTVLKENGIV